ncbi:MAG: hypothetical protein QM760_09230 [Nibricoccus sp.]
MNLLVLMYHRASAGKHGNSPEKIDAHFAHIARNFNCVVPATLFAMICSTSA